MYEWRHISNTQREKLLRGRKADRQPWHAPPRFNYENKTRFIVTAACYEHASVIGLSGHRMAEFEKSLLDLCAEFCLELFAWCLLPNHYHLLIETPDIQKFQAALGKLHGRTSYEWNSEDGRRGRKVWYRSFERPIDSDRHFFVSLNYIHNNAVKHGYVKTWHEWPYSSGAQYLANVGRDEAVRIWLEYPVLGYGESWDK